MDRYREYGVISERDEQLRRAFRDGFKRAGLSFPRLLEGLAWYRDRARHGGDEAQLLDAFSEYASHQSWSTEHRDAAIDIYRAIRDGGPEAVMDAIPAPAQDRATISRAEELLRLDPSHYWADPEMQEALFEAQERVGGRTDATAAEVPAIRDETAQQRVKEIEALLHDPSGVGQRRYWNDATLRTDYERALACLQDAPAETGHEAPISAAVTPVTGGADEPRLNVPLG
jgi:hypothetical protein